VNLQRRAQGRFTRITAMKGDRALFMPPIRTAQCGRMTRRRRQHLVIAANCVAGCTRRALSRATLATACHQNQQAEGPLERAGKHLDNAAEKTASALKLAAEKTGEAAGKAGCATGTAFGKVGDKLGARALPRPRRRASHFSNGSGARSAHLSG
jgi:hypothetical protein